jgi:hypothetical protein
MTTRDASAAALSPGITVGELLEACPALMEVLEDFGIKLDPWTMIALNATVQEIAEYSAIRRPDELREALRARMEREAP